MAPWGDKVAGKKIVLYLGRLHPKKGLVNLLRAWRKVAVDCRSNAAWVLAVVGWGQGGHEIELQKLSQELGLEKSVLFLGPLFGRNKQACYENADAFILPSLSEGLPMTVLEAWAYGLPVLMTPQCNLQEGFDCGAALRIEPEVDKISESLVQLFTLSNIQRKEMGSRGIELVQQRFSWRKVTDQLHNVYQWIMGGGIPPDCVRFS
jgi:poly(glycerol-phosphate) alpha-glucosyltransferase